MTYGGLASRVTNKVYLMNKKTLGQIVDTDGYFGCEHAKERVTAAHWMSEIREGLSFRFVLCFLSSNNNKKCMCVCVIIATQ